MDLTYYRSYEIELLRKDCQFAMSNKIMYDNCSTIDIATLLQDHEQFVVVKQTLCYVGSSVYETNLTEYESIN